MRWLTYLMLTIVREFITRYFAWYDKQRERELNVIMAEAESPQEVKRNPLVEKIGTDKVRALAALGIAAAGLFGVASGKANVGAGVAVETTNPFTGQPIAALLDVESTERSGWELLGIAGDITDRARGASGVATIVQVGGAKVRVGYTELDRGDGVVILAVHPAAAISNVASRREVATREALAQK